LATTDDVMAEPNQNDLLTQMELRQVS